MSSLDVYIPIQLKCMKSLMQENKRKVKNMHELYFNTKSGYYGRNLNNFGIINFSVRPLYSAIKNEFL